ncbi:MAG: PstC family ABC transporter permease, partial [Blastocatellia bacterium]
MARTSVRLSDKVFERSTQLCAAAIAATMLLIVAEMLRSSWPSISRYGWAFLWGSTWDAVHDKFGALPSIYGTIVSALIALIVSVPVSIGIAVFLTEYAPRKLRTPAAFVIQLLAAIPSVVYGMWGIFVLAPLLRNYIYPPLQKTLGFLPIFQGNPTGLGLLSAG